MKKFLVLSLATLASVSAFGQFVNGTLVYGYQAATGDASAASVDKTTGATGTPLTLTGFRFSSSSAGGGLKGDINGNLYAPGASSTASTSPRVGRIDTSGTFSYAAVAGTATMRGAAPMTGGGFVLGTTTTSSGLATANLVFDNGTTVASTTALGTAATSRIVVANGADVFITRASATATSNGVFKNNTTAASQVATTTTAATTGLVDLWISFDGLTMFAADERTTAGTGGIVKYTRPDTASSFTQQYIMSTATGSATTGAKYVTAEESAPGVFTIYAATAEATGNRMVKLSDSSSATADLLFTAPSTDSIKGVAIVPEPATMAALGLGLAGLAARRRRK